MIVFFRDVAGIPSGSQKRMLFKRLVRFGGLCIVMLDFFLEVMHMPS